MLRRYVFGPTLATLALLLGALPAVAAPPPVDSTSRLPQ